MPVVVSVYVFAAWQEPVTQLLPCIIDSSSCWTRVVLLPGGAVPGVTLPLLRLPPPAAVVNGFVQEKLTRAHAIADVTAKWQLGDGLTLQQQFGWIGQLPAPPLQQPPPTASLTERLQFMLTSW